MPIWNYFYGHLPPGATLLSVTLSSDKTKLSTMMGNYVAHPLLIMLVNIDLALQLSTSSHAFPLVALLPIPKFVGIKKGLHSILKNRLTHSCLDLMTHLLKTTSQHGCWLSDYAGNVQLCFMPLVAYIVNAPEAVMLTGVAGKTSHLTTPVYKQFGDSFQHPPWTTASILTLLKTLTSHFNPSKIATYTTNVKCMFCLNVLTACFGKIGVSQMESPLTHTRFSPSTSSTTSTRHFGIMTWNGLSELLATSNWTSAFLCFSHTVDTTTFLLESHHWSRSLNVKIRTSRDIFWSWSPMMLMNNLSSASGPSLIYGTSHNPTRWLTTTSLPSPLHSNYSMNTNKLSLTVAFTSASRAWSKTLWFPSWNSCTPLYCASVGQGPFPSGQLISANTSISITSKCHARTPMDVNMPHKSAKILIARRSACILTSWHNAEMQFHQIQSRSAILVRYLTLVTMPGSSNSLMLPKHSTLVKRLTYLQFHLTSNHNQNLPVFPEFLLPPQLPFIWTFRLTVPHWP